jgi:predicted DNA-binding WGR domain protein
MPTTATKRRFEYTDDTSNKFWEIEVKGKEVVVRWGRIGTNGQAQTKEFADAVTADNHAAKLIAQKLARGYQEMK